MFDPTCIILNGRWGYAMRHEGRDYYRRSNIPLRVLMNPLRIEVGIGSSRPCAVVINKNAWMHQRMSNLLFRLRAHRNPRNHD